MLLDPLVSLSYFIELASPICSFPNTRLDDHSITQISNPSPKKPVSAMELLPENRVFGPPCPGNVDWNNAKYQQELLAKLPGPSSHEKAYEKWRRRFPKEPTWAQLNFMARAQWFQFYLNFKTEDLKIEVDGEETEDDLRDEMNRYRDMYERTHKPEPVKKEKETKFYFEDVPPASSGPSSNSYYRFVDMTGKSKKKVYYGTGYEVKPESSYGADCSGSTSRGTLDCALTFNGPLSPGYGLPPIPALAPDSMINPVLLAAGMQTYDISNRPVASVPSMLQQTMVQPMPSTQAQPPKHEYNQFPMTGPVFLSPYQSPYGTQRISKSLAQYNSPYHSAFQNQSGSSGSQSFPKPHVQYNSPYALAPLEKYDQHPSI